MENHFQHEQIANIYYFVTMMPAWNGMNAGWQQVLPFVDIPTKRARRSFKTGRYWYVLSGFYLILTILLLNRMGLVIPVETTSMYIDPFLIVSHHIYFLRMFWDWDRTLIIFLLEGKGSSRSIEYTRAG